ncbi:MAG TPA: ABC-2 family transporter protein [Acidimicrobiales bacterium]|jgi:ABC-2 type transport system permease protein|nr:ABC-2 family transporter protein [Acidimicrobiales bacterium]
MIWRAFTVSLGTAMRRVLAQPASLMFTVGFYLAVTSVVSSLWRTAADASGGLVVGYTAVALTWYIATSEAVTIALNQRVIEETGEAIASGAVAVELLRPVSVLLVRVAMEIGHTLPRLATCILVGLAYAQTFAGEAPNLVALALAVPSMVLAVTCNLLAQHAFAAVSFWIRDSRSTWFLYQKLVFIAGGMLLPLEVLPDGMEAVTRVLPFMAMAYAPARLASGHVEPMLLLVQIAWLVVLGGLAVAAFSKGEARLRVVGG